MNKEQFVEHYIKYGAVYQEDVVSYTDSCSVNVVIEHKGKYYRGRIYQDGNPCLLLRYSSEYVGIMMSEPERVQPRKITVTKYVPFVKGAYCRHTHLITDSRGKLTCKACGTLFLD